MKSIRALTCILILLTVSNAHSQISIIPQPNSIEYGKGHFILDNHIHLCIPDSSVLTEALIFMEDAAELAGIKVEICQTKPCKRNYIEIIRRLDNSPEAYSMLITKKKISILSSGNEGIFHGFQSLLQIICSAEEDRIPAALIRDSPNFSWRGMHLDVCRHFFSKDEVKKYIDYLSIYKMNVFHWHLTEDQGWRMEIKKYPKLTEIGGWRNGSMVGPYSDQKFDSIRYGGFYTQEDIRDIVAYAAARHINVLPEIEMPGHALAALAAYPQFACTGGPFEVGKAWGVYEDVYCAGNEGTFTFLQDILDEVVELFPFEYIHIGGDECPKNRWKACGKCQRRMKENSLKDEHELQSYFIQRIEKYLNAKGKKIIGWDEILEGGLAPNAEVMSWRGTEGGIAAARQGHSVIMTPGKPCYFDHYQHPDTKNEPHAIGGLNTLKDVYDYDPVPAVLNEKEKIFIKGAQGNVWTEYMNDFSHVEYMALPRMGAMAEVLWTGKNQKNYDHFILRLREQSRQLDKKGANYCRHFLKEIMPKDK